MRRSALVTSLCLALALACAVCGKIIYVDDDANAPGDGKSWATAYRYLQDALQETKAPVQNPPGSRAIRAGTVAKADPNEGPPSVEIRVARGLYTPDRGAKQTPGDRRASFELKQGVLLKGGYVGLGAPDPNSRDIALHETILSGDLAGNDVVVDDPCDLQKEPTRAENSYHVVCIENADDSVLLEGFTVTGGYAWLMGGAVGDYLSEYSGAGLRCRLSENAKIAKCSFKANFAHSGGGISNYSSSDMSVIECTFLGNAAGADGGGMASGGRTIFEKCAFIRNQGAHGGGISNAYAQITLNGCSFVENSARAGGGGLLVVGGALAFNDCIFRGNSAQWGGAIRVYVDHNSVLANCLFDKNLAEEKGGAIDCNADKQLLIQNSTFVKNSSPTGTAISARRNLSINSAILWDGGQEINDTSSVGVAYSDVQGGWAGTGNIDADPLFADLDNGDYHLRSQGGRWDPVSETWVQDNVTSPCIDRGDPNKPIGLEAFPNGGRINIGYYGGTTEASKSYLGARPCETIIGGDINGDCRVDFIDLAILAYHWLQGGEQGTGI